MSFSNTVFTACPFVLWHTWDPSVDLWLIIFYHVFNCEYVSNYNDYWQNIQSAGAFFLMREGGIEGGRGQSHFMMFYLIFVFLVTSCQESKLRVSYIDDMHSICNHLPRPPWIPFQKEKVTIALLPRRGVWNILFKWQSWHLTYFSPYQSWATCCNPNLPVLLLFSLFGSIYTAICRAGSNSLGKTFIYCIHSLTDSYARTQSLINVQRSNYPVPSS